MDIVESCHAYLHSTLEKEEEKKRGQLDTRNKGMYSDTTFLLQLKCMLATLCGNFPAALCYQYNKAI